MRAERFADLLHRYRYALFGVWLIHAFLMHWFVLGFLSWDGFGYRGLPIVELYQHGSVDASKFSDWTLVGHTPFLELVHLPFLYVFGLKGFLIGFPLVVFPLAAWAVYLLVHELTSDHRAATFGALTYVAIPMVNQQPFTAYIDFAVVGVLAFFVYSLLRVRSNDRRLVVYTRLAIATALFTLARSQGVYVIIVMTPILVYAAFATRDGWRIKVADWRTLGVAAVVIAIGSIPAIALQIWKYREYGSPIAPMQFQLLGIKVGTGVPIDSYFLYAGLGGSDFGSLAKGFVEGWVWHSGWPIGAFYASRFMAAGLLFDLALVLLVVFLPRSTRIERWLLVAGLLVSLLSRDFAVPRWSYTTVIAIVVITGRALATLAASSSLRGRIGFWVATSLVALHLLRPEIDVLQLRSGYLSPRMNITDSSYFAERPDDKVRLYPNRNFKMVIIESVGFQLQLYGRRLTNEIIDTIPGGDVGKDCKGLAPIIQQHPHVVFVDDRHFTKDCPRICKVTWPDAPWYCGAWQVHLPR